MDFDEILVLSQKWGELHEIPLTTLTGDVQSQLNTLEHPEVKPLNLNKMSFLNSRSKTFRINHISPPTWRKVFLIENNEVFRSKKKIIYDRHSTVPSIFVGSTIKIYSGTKFHTRFVNRWMVGYKFGEFSWTRKLALYKAKQLKKKKK